MVLEKLTEFLKQSLKKDSREAPKGSKMMSMAHDVTATTLTGWENC